MMSTTVTASRSVNTRFAVIVADPVNDIAFTVMELVFHARAKPARSFAEA